MRVTEFMLNLFELRDKQCFFLRQLAFSCSRPLVPLALQLLHLILRCQQALLQIPLAHGMRFAKLITNLLMLRDKQGFFLR